MEEGNQNYIDTKLKSIIEPMLTQLIIKRPEDVPSFMLEWVKKTYNYQDSEEEKSDPQSNSSDDVMYECKEKEEEAPISIPLKSRDRFKPRQSVSAEVYGAWNKKESFKPKIIPKTEEQKARIEEKLKISFIFNSLDENELTIVVDAMEEKKFMKDDVVIKQGDEGEELYVVDSGTLSCYRKFVSFSP